MCFVFYLTGHRVAFSYTAVHTKWFHIQISNLTLFHFRLERAKKLQEQKEKEMFEKQQQQQQEIAAGEMCLLGPLLKPLSSEFGLSN